MYVCVFVCVFTYVCLCQYIYVNKNDCVCSGVLAFIVKLQQGCIFRLTCSHGELTEDHVLTSAYVKIFRTVTRNAVNKSV